MARSVVQNEPYMRSFATFGIQSVVRVTTGLFDHWHAVSVFTACYTLEEDLQMCAVFILPVCRIRSQVA
jgi:hypothetical protein